MKSCIAMSKRDDGDDSNGLSLMQLVLAMAVALAVKGIRNPISANLTSRTMKACCKICDVACPLSLAGVPHHLVSWKGFEGTELFRFRNSKVMLIWNFVDLMDDEAIRKRTLMVELL